MVVGSWAAGVSLFRIKVGGHQDRAPLVALAEHLEEQFRSGGGQGHEAQFVDNQQAEAGQLPLQVEQPSLVSGSQRSALPPLFTTGARRPSAVSQPVYFAAMALLDRRACRMVAESGGPGWKQPCLRPRLETPTICSSGGGWKTRLKTRWQKAIL